MDWHEKWLVDLNAGKTQLVSFDQSDVTGSIDVKMDGSVLEEKSSFKMLRLTFSSKFEWGSYIISIAKTAPYWMLPIHFRLGIGYNRNLTKIPHIPQRRAV